MKKTSLFVFAKISPKPEFYPEAKQAIVDILSATREEVGCYQFELHESPTQEVLYLYEEWENQAALDEHYQKPYTAAVFESYQEWLAAPVEIMKMNKCSESL